MGSNLVEKLFSRHLVDESSDEVGLSVDQTLTQDATGTMAYLQYEALSAGRVKTLSVSYVDHNTVQQGFENADDHAYLRSVARKYGIVYSKAGNGICHQVHLERFARPGALLLGSDSHTPTAGGAGCLAFGAGGLDIALAMAGQPYYVKRPKAVNVRLRGAFGDFISSKDVVLKVLSILSTKGNAGSVIEYSGVGGLSVPERATIANMGAELGAASSVFPSDGRTLDFLKAQGRGGDWEALSADSDASYDRTIDTDLGSLEPLVAAPHSPDNVSPASKLDVAVDQVCVGSCTNSSYKDLMTAAGMLKGRRVRDGVEFIVSPGSRQVLKMISENGALSALIGAGARVAEPACGFCIGASHAPRSGGVSLRTNNRNFMGRSGTRDAKVYLSGVEVAVASALTGRITDPRTLGIKPPVVQEPAAYYADDGMFERAYDPGASVLRGPNIGPPFLNTPPADVVAGVIELKVGDKVTTDHIMPAGGRMKYRSNIPAYSQYVFEPLDGGFAGRAEADKARSLSTFIVAGESYGQGSSREHAAICPAYLGVRAIMAKSFERIHQANLVNFGVLPLVFADPGDWERFGNGMTAELSGVKSALGGGEAVLAAGAVKARLKLELTGRQVSVLSAGGALPYAKGRLR